jgi:hypothetical protein
MMTGIMHRQKYGQEHGRVEDTVNFHTEIGRRLALIRVHDRGAPDLAWVLRRLRGVSPSDLLDCCPTLRYHSHQPRGRTIHLIAAPEPHPLDYDWRFTLKTAEWLVGVLTGLSTPAVLLGMPTVARILRDHNVAFTGFDRNPIHSDHINNAESAIDFRCANSNRRRPVTASVIAMDPPWYPNEVRSWISFALRQVVNPQVLLLSIWPELTRPGAGIERAQLLEWLELLGSVSIHEDCLDYELPLFEELALTERGIALHEHWRKGDLVMIRLKPNCKELSRAMADSVSRPSGVITWNRFLVGKRQVAIRCQPNEARKVAFLPLSTAPYWHLDSVSRRDPRRGEVDIWASNNVVARLRGGSDLINAMTAYFCQCAPWSILESGACRALEELAVRGFVESLDRDGRSAMWQHYD